MASDNEQAAVAADREPGDVHRTAEEAAIAARILAHRRKVPKTRPKMKDGRLHLEIDHPCDTAGQLLLMNAFGTTEEGFVDPLLVQMANVVCTGRESDSDAFGFMLSVVKGIEPRDQMEAMLAGQMAAVHMATMTFARRLAHVENIPQQDSAAAAFNKLARTFAAQMETLKRYRTGGEQKVTVQHQHVTVNEGGQAVVGTVNHRGRGRQKNEG